VAPKGPKGSECVNKATTKQVNKSTGSKQDTTEKLQSTLPVETRSNDLIDGKEKKIAGGVTAVRNCKSALEHNGATPQEASH
jgi:hypothetical protein